VPEGENYVLSTDKTDLQTAIDLAKAREKSGGSQADINKALTALQAAIQHFKDQFKTGTGAVADKALLIALIEEAAQLLGDTAVGDDPASVPDGVSYVTPAQKAALQQAYDAAVTARNRTSITQTEIDAIAEELQTATDTFYEAKDSQVGTLMEWTYIVSFNLNYAGAGDPPASITIDSFPTLADQGEVLPVLESREHFEFGGWYTTADGSGQPFTEHTALTGNVQLYAKWLEAYYVTYHLDGGTITGQTADDNGDVHAVYTTVNGLTLPVPVKAAYRFGGWYADSGFTGQSVTAIPAGETGDKEFWVRWAGVQFDIKFNGSLNNDIDTAVPAYYVTKTSGNDSAPNNGAVVYEDGVFGAGGPQSVKLDISNFLRLDDTRTGNGANSVDPLTGFNYNRSFTVAFWAKVNSAGGTDPVLFSNKQLNTSYQAAVWSTNDGNGRKTTGLAFYLSPETGGQRDLRLNTVGAGDADRLLVDGNDPVLATNVIGQWVHVAAVYDKAAGINGQVRYYANGVKLGEAETDLNSSVPVYVTVAGQSVFVGYKTGMMDHPEAGGAVSYLNMSAGHPNQLYTRSNQTTYSLSCNYQNFILKEGAMTDAEVAAMVDDALPPGAPTTPVLTATASTDISGRFTYSWTPTAESGVTYCLYIKAGTSAESDPAAIATADALVTGAASPGTYTGIAGGKYNVVVKAAKGSQTVYSTPRFVETGDYTPVAPALTFATGTTNDGEISYSWTAGAYVAGHELYVAIGSYTTAADVIANGWLIRTATPAEEAAGVPTTTVKGNPGLTYSAVVKSLNGVTPVYSNVVSAAAKGTLSATTNITQLRASVTRYGDRNGTETGSYDHTKIVDDDLGSRYAASTAAIGAGKGIGLTFGLPVQADSGVFYDYMHGSGTTIRYGRTRELKIQYKDRSGGWQDAYWFNMPNSTNGPVGGNTDTAKMPVEFYETVQSTEFRMLLLRAQSNDVSFYEWKMFDAGLAATEGTNIAPKATVTASSVNNASYPAASAVDNNAGSRWAITSADWDDDECWLQLEYTTPQTVNKAAIRSFADRITSFKIQYDNGGIWVDAYSYSGSAVPGYTHSNTTSLAAWVGTVTKNPYSFTSVTSTKFRLLITGDHTVASSDPSIWEFYLYSPN
jgi:uncharacterized repeat protein (TIGR02543 family)